MHERNVSFLADVCNDESFMLYSLSSKKATVGHKNFSFCEQTLHKGLLKIQFPRTLFSSLHNISSYNPHTILKKCTTRSTKKIY